MKTRMQALAAAWAVAGCLASAPAAAGVVSISGPSTVGPGSTFQLEVDASGFTDLYAYQFDVVYDPTLFKARNVVEGAFLSSAGTTFFDGGTVDDVAGTITFILGTLIGPGAGASGAGVLAQLSFDAIGARQSAGAFRIDNLIALDSSLAGIDTNVRGLVVSIPEPASAWLVVAALGLAALGPRVAAGRRRQPGRVAA